MKNEKIIDGKLCWRVSSLDGEWIEYSREELTLKINELERLLNVDPPDDNSLYEKAPWWANPNIKPIHMDVTC